MKRPGGGHDNPFAEKPRSRVNFLVLDRAAAAEAVATAAYMQPVHG